MIYKNSVNGIRGGLKLTSYIDCNSKIRGIGGSI
jgi:hypothetical protein